MLTADGGEQYVKPRGRQNSLPCWEEWRCSPINLKEPWGAIPTIPVKLSSATTCHKLLSTATLGFNLCHFEGWGGREGRKGWVKREEFPRSIPSQHGQCYQSRSCWERSRSKHSSYSCCQGSSASSRKTHGRRPGWQQGKGEPRKDVTGRDGGRSGKPAAWRAPPAAQKADGKGETLSWRLIAFNFLFVAKITFPPSLSPRHQNPRCRARGRASRYAFLRRGDSRRRYAARQHAAGTGSVANVYVCLLICIAAVYVV